MLTQELKAHTPPQWQVRVRWYDGKVLGSIMPWPYQAAFDLWYDNAKRSDTLRDLCPPQNDRVWALLQPGDDIVLESTVGGKSMIEARVSCRMMMEG